MDQAVVPVDDVPLRLGDEAGPHRAIQVGLGGEAVDRYVDEWITHIEDVTPLAHEIHGLVQAGGREQASRRLPLERPLALGADAAAAVGAD